MFEISQTNSTSLVSKFHISFSSDYKKHVLHAILFLLILSYLLSLLSHIIIFIFTTTLFSYSPLYFNFSLYINNLTNQSERFREFNYSFRSYVSLESPNVTYYLYTLKEQVSNDLPYMYRQRNRIARWIKIRIPGSIASDRSSTIVCPCRNIARENSGFLTTRHGC